MSKARHGRLSMAREFFNDRRKPSPTSAGYQQVAGGTPPGRPPPPASRGAAREAGHAPAPVVGNWEQLLAQGAEQARARQWPKAAADFAAALAIHPDDHWQWFRAATLLAWTEDQTAYRRHCAEMLRRFGETTELPIAER